MLQLAVFTSSYSNYRFAYLYHRQDTLAFMDAHVKFFEHTAGVYHQMVYDNMRIVVARFIGKNEAAASKEPTQALCNLKAHYRFTHRFCNAGRGNEKGHVERSVEYIRRKAFSIHDEFSCIEMAQQHLTEVVQQLNQIKQQNTDTSAQSLFEKEKPFLWSVATTSFASYIVEQLRVDKYATFSYRGNRYSVPDYLVGEFVDVKIASETLTAYYQDTVLCTHARNYGNHQWVIQLDHYLSTFHKKPSALPQSEAFYQSAPFLRQLYTTHFTESARDFVELLLHCQQHQIGVDRLREAYQHLLQVCPTSVNTEKLVAILGNKPIDQTQKKEQQDQIAIASIKHLQALSNLI